MRRVDDDGSERSLVVKEQVEIARLAMLGIEANERAPGQRRLRSQRGKRHQTRSWIAESLFGDIGKRIPSAQ